MRFPLGASVGRLLEVACFSAKDRSNISATATLTLDDEHLREMFDQIPIAPSIVHMCQCFKLRTYQMAR